MHFLAAGQWAGGVVAAVLALLATGWPSTTAAPHDLSGASIAGVNLVEAGRLFEHLLR